MIATAEQLRKVATATGKRWKAIKKRAWAQPVIAELGDLRHERRERKPALPPRVGRIIDLMDLKAKKQKNRDERAEREAASEAVAATFWLSKPSRGRSVKRDTQNELDWFLDGWGSRRDLRRATSQLIAACAARHMAYRPRKAGRWTEDYQSASGSCYVRRAEMRLRLSDHDLGYADYGSREQVHDGPEVIFHGTETWREVLKMVVEATRDYR